MSERFVWTAADGRTAIDLTDEAAGYSVLAAGTRGLRSVSYAVTTAEYAGIDGVTVAQIKATANTPTLGLMLEAPDEETFTARARHLVHTMRPKAGPGTLTVFRGDGSSRSLACYATEGLEGDWAPDVTLPGAWWKLAVKLFAPDPWWRGREQTLDFGLAAPSVFLSAVLPFPRMLSASTIQGQHDVDLTDADAPAHPVWTITGPGSGLTLSNRTTDPLTGKLSLRTIQVNTVIGDGQTVVIDTRPGRQSVRRGDGTNLMGALASDPALWPLVDGQVNDVTATLGAAGQASRIRGVFTPRYAGF